MKSNEFVIKVVGESSDFVSLFNEIEKAVQIMKHLHNITQVSVVKNESEDFYGD